MRQWSVLLCYVLWMIQCSCSALRSFVIQPGGVKGFYMTGICKYIRDHYDLSDWNYYGASAGAWNVMYLGCKPEKEELFIQQAQEIGQFSYTSLYDMEKTMKQRLMVNFKLEDFNIPSMNICVSSKRNWQPLLRKEVIREFYDMDDLVECCIASSHLPFITNGEFFYHYRARKCLDGGFFRKPYTREDNVIPSMILNPEIWKNTQMNQINRIHTLDIHSMMYYGYNDAYNHRWELDKLFDV